MFLSSSFADWAYLLLVICSGECALGGPFPRKTSLRDPVVPFQKVRTETLLCRFGGSRRTF